MKKTSKKPTTKASSSIKKMPAKATKPAALTKAPAAPKAGQKLTAKPAVKKSAVAPASAVTRITGVVDVGFGNSLYLRGEGGGLSWDKGVLLDCVANDKWTITLAESAKSIECKFLLNDVAWCVGNDYIVPAGSSAVLKPTF